MNISVKIIMYASFYICMAASGTCVLLELTGSSSYAVLDQSFTFTCTARQAAGFQDVVEFNKQSESAYIGAGSLDQTTSGCSVWSSAPAGYSVSCGSGTSSSSSSTKTYTLTINRAADRDATNWYCKKLSASTHSNIVSLQFSKGPDSIRFSPTSPGTIIEGRTLSVRCSADCVPSSCSFSWKQGNTHISSNSQLTQTNIRRDQTLFTCTATNTFTSTSKSRDFQLTVYYPPSASPVISGTTFPVNEDNLVTLHCSTTGGKPKPNLSWLCSGVSGSASCSDSGETRNCTISFTANSNQNNKNCVCTPAWQYGGYTQSKSIHMNIYYQSTITSVKLNSQSTEVIVDELTAMTLSCDVDSNPASDIKLLNNSQTLYEVKNSKTAEYTWNEARCLDTGRYTCEAGNNIKSAVSQSVQLTVRCSPRLDHRVLFKDIFATSLGGNVTLSISVIANPTPTFTWYRLTDGKKTKLGSSNSVTTADASAVGIHKLKNVQERDIGIYQVVVSNRGPEYKLLKNFTVVAQGPPSIPSDVRTRNTGSSSICVAWIEEFNGGLRQMFLVQYRDDEETSEWRNVSEVFPQRRLHTIHITVISNLQPNTRYLVRVLAYNREGSKGFTTEHNVLTGESLPTCIREKDSSLGVGPGIGFGIGIMVVIILLVGGMMFMYRQMKTAKSKTKTTYESRQFHAGVQESTLYEDLGETRDTTRVLENRCNAWWDSSASCLPYFQSDSTSNVSANVSNAYSTLATRTDTPYEVLGVYENSSQIKQV